MTAVGGLKLIEDHRSIPDSEFLYTNTLSYPNLVCQVAVESSLLQSAMPKTDDGADFADDSALLAKDAHTRRRYLQWFNKRRDDFDTDRAYDDYLEMVEDVIFKLVNGIDVVETKAFVDKYRRENADSISVNAALRAEENRKMLEEVKDDQRERLNKLAAVRAEDESRKKEKERRLRREKAEALVLATHGEKQYRKIVRKRERREKREREKREEEAAVASAPVDVEPMFFRPNFPSALPVAGPLVHTAEEMREIDFNYSDETAIAGGFEPELVAKRARLEFEQSWSVLLST